MLWHPDHHANALMTTKICATTAIQHSGGPQGAEHQRTVIPGDTQMLFTRVKVPPPTKRPMQPILGVAPSSKSGVFAWVRSWVPFQDSLGECLGIPLRMAFSLWQCFFWGVVPRLLNNHSVLTKVEFLWAPIFMGLTVFLYGKCLRRARVQKL